MAEELEDKVNKQACNMFINSNEENIFSLVNFCHTQKC